MPCCYIIYSPSIDQYYVGATHGDFDEKLSSHKSGKYSASYTAKVSDWEEYILIKVDSYSHALAVERHIKRMKSKVYVANLKKYPELREKLIEITKA